jgi:hypothetical protein
VAALLGARDHQRRGDEGGREDADQHGQTERLARHRQQPDAQPAQRGPDLDHQFGTYRAEP